MKWFQLKKRLPEPEAESPASAAADPSARTGEASGPSGHTPAAKATDASAPDWQGLREPVEQPKPRRRFPFWAVGCALVIALGMLAPAAMFALTDTAFFSNREQTEGGYQSLTPKGSDYYLVRLLHERRDANYASNTAQGNGQGGFYYQNNTGTLPTDYSLAPKVEQVLNEYTDREILSMSWLDLFYYDLAADDVILENSLSGTSDTLGFLSIACDEGGIRRLGITMEAHTGKVVELFLRVPGPDYDDYPGARQILNQWIALNDLEGLGDWIVPTGTCWEDFSLYSARGKLMATCWRGTNGEDSFFWLDLQPCTPEMLAAGTYPAPAEESAITDELLDRDTLRRPIEGEGAVWSDGNTGYYLEVMPGGGAQVRYLDYIANTDGCVCRKPGCTHDTTDCPAYLTPEEMSYTSPRLFGAEGCVYLVPSGNQSIGSEDEAIDILLMENRPPTQENIDRMLHAGIDRISADGLTRETIAQLPEDASDWYCVAVDGTKAYFARSLIYQESEEPGEHYQICDVSTGQITESPALFFRYEEVLGCYGGCLLIRRPLDPMDILHYWSQALGTTGQSTTQSCYELVDPATGQRRAVFTGEASGTYPQSTRLFAARDRLVLVGGAGRVIMMDLRTGAVEETTLPDVLMERVLVDPMSVDSHIAEDCGLPWMQFCYDDTVFYYDPTTGEIRKCILEGPCVVRAMAGDGRAVAENLADPDRSSYLAGPPDELWRSTAAFVPLLRVDG